MTSTRDRDRTVEQLLRQRTPDGAGVPADGCFDADLVAAWMDGALTREELSAAEAHAAGCARCQQLLAAYARTELATAAPVEPRWPFRSALRWLVPLTAAAAAVAVWIAVRPIASVAPASDARLDSAARLESAVRPEAPAQAAPAAPPPALVADTQRSAGASDELSKVARDAKLVPQPSAPADFERRERAKVEAPVPAERADAAKSAGATVAREAVAADKPSVASPPAAAPAPVAGAANARALTDRAALRQSAAESVAVAVLEIHSSDTTIVWRVRPDGAVERSADTGQTWETQYTGPAARITAGSSPAPTVCWLVGRSGSILVSTDGRTWRRVGFVEAAADLVEVQARDGDRATVVTSDRRRFTDRGRRPDLDAIPPARISRGSVLGMKGRKRPRTAKEPFMRKQVCCGVLMAAGVVFSTLSSSTGAAPARPVGQDTSTLDDQIDLAVTVYNSNIALVRDVRNLQLASGHFNLRFMDVAATVNPATVHFRSLTEPSRLDVVEQNYEYQTFLEPDKLLRKYVGRDVTLVQTRQENGTTREEEVTARLLSYNNGPVWKVGNEIVTGLRADHMRFPTLPDNLYSRPTLIWTLDNTGATRHRVEASYLAGKLAWNADYVLTVGRDDKAADLDGWVTLTNGSGTSFRNARLQLVAGDLNRVRSEISDLRMDRAAARESVAAGKMAQESFSEYHLYTLDRKTTINNSETKQVSMLSGTGVPVQKRYVVDGQAFYYRNASHPGAPLKDDVQVYYQFRNDEKAGLGMPMPAGTVRVYQADSKGGVQFAGEDHIDHTPKDETLKLKIGNAFDVVCERNQKDFQKIAGLTYEVEYEVTLRNHKAIPVTVEVNEPVGGTWQMLRSSHTWTKTAAWAAQFTVPVAAEGEATLKYRVRVTY